MKNNIKQNIFTLTLAILLATPIISSAYCQKYIDQIQALYLKSFGISLEINEPIEPPFQSLTEQIKYILNSKPLTLSTLSAQEIRNSALRACKKNICNAHSSINLHLAEKMELVHGVEENSGDHLAFRLSSASNTQSVPTASLVQTESGKAFIAYRISQPHTDTVQLIKGQRIINACSTNNQLRAALTKILKKMGNGEAHFLSYHSDKDLVHTWATHLKQSYYWKTPVLTKLNNSAYGLQTNMIASHVMKLLDAPLQVLGIRFALKKGYQKLNVEYTGAVQQITNAATAFNAYKMAPTLLNSISDIKLMTEVNNLLQIHLMGTADYINGAKKLYTLIQHHPEITKNFDALQELEALVQPSQKHSAEFNEFVELLGTPTFKGKPSHFSMMGRVLRAHALMSIKSVQEEFAAVINAIGELDTYVALAEKIHTTKDLETRYSLVEFDITSDVPYFKATGLWNPFVCETKAITNTVELGGTQPRNIILSGPNTGGKSTLSKAVLINTILAQTFGVAASQSMILTPFSNLDCYLNMTDHTASGISGLQAEVNRAKAIIEQFKTSPGFSLFLLDEIFTATSPEQAEALAVEFISILCENPRCLFINAVHFEGLIQFAEQSKDCRNCHMGAVVNAEGKVLEYTYKLAEGRSNVKNAQQISQQAFSLR